MTANNSIFLYITEGRTLWVPGHTPAAGENKPVHILNFATPRELSRSFYLFDMPIQLVPDAQTAAMIPGGKTPEDVIIAVNEFRRVCTEDQDFLLRRCYDANKPPPPQQQQQVQQAQQAQAQQLLLPGAGTGGIGDSFNLQQNPSLNVAQSNPNQAFLLQLLQQQQQQQQRMAMMPQASPLQQPPPMTFNRGSMMGVGGNMMMNNGGMMMPPNLPMMPNNNNNNYGNHMMSFGRGVGLMPAPNSTHSIFPGMGTGPVPTMMGGGRGMGRGGRMLNNAFQAPVREQPEPLPPLAPIPDDILQIYMNPQQKLMCATMPGPRCTVWLREHEIPTDTRNPRYVFCKGGIVLMLKTKGTEIEKSKPVELFEQQVCAHFLIHNYCSRTNCLHRHHTEAQLRQLIASKHVQLKSMTKKERHRLSELVLEKDREGLARIAEDREQRAKERLEQAKRREAMSGGSGTTTNNNNNNTTKDDNNNNSNNTTNNSNNRDDNTVASGSTDVSRTLPARSNVGGSDDDEDEESANSNDNNNNKTTDNATTSNRVNDKKEMSHKSGEQRTVNQENGSNKRNPVESTGPSSRRAAPFSSRRVQSTVDIGVTDSEDDDDDDSSSTASSSSSSSSSSNSSRKTNEAAEAKEKSEEAANSKERAGSEKEAEETKATAVSLMVSEACMKKEGGVPLISEMDVKMTVKDEKAHEDHTMERETELAQQQQQQQQQRKEEEEEEKEKEKKSVVVEEEEEEKEEKEEEKEKEKEKEEVKESSDVVHKPAESDNEEEEETNVVDEKKKKAKPRGKNSATKHGRSPSPKKTATKSKRTKK